MTFLLGFMVGVLVMAALTVYLAECHFYYEDESEEDYHVED